MGSFKNFSHSINKSLAIFVLIFLLLETDGLTLSYYTIFREKLNNNPELFFDINSTSYLAFLITVSIGLFFLDYIKPRTLMICTGLMGVISNLLLFSNDVSLLLTSRSLLGCSIGVTLLTGSKVCFSSVKQKYIVPFMAFLILFASPGSLLVSTLSSFIRPLDNFNAVIIVLTILFAVFAIYFSLNDKLNLNRDHTPIPRTDRHSIFTVLFNYRFWFASFIFIVGQLFANGFLHPLIATGVIKHPDEHLRTTLQILSANSSFITILGYIVFGFLSHRLLHYKTLIIVLSNLISAGLFYAILTLGASSYNVMFVSVATIVFLNTSSILVFLAIWESIDYRASSLAIGLLMFITFYINYGFQEYIKWGFQNQLTLSETLKILPVLFLLASFLGLFLFRKSPKLSDRG